MPIPPLTAASVLWIEPNRPLTCRWGFRDVVLFRQDLGGVTETRTVTFDFTQSPEIQSGDSLAAAYIDQSGFTGSTAWTISTPVVGTSTVKATFSSATPPGQYAVSCRVLTAAGYTLEIPGILVLLPSTMPAPVVQFHEDLQLVQENRLAAFDYRYFPEMMGGDILAGTPVVIQTGPLGTTPLTVAVKGIATSNSQVVVDVTGGGPAWTTYTLTCRCPTQGGSVLEVVGTFVLAGSS